MTKFWSGLAGLSLLASAGMYYVGGNDPALTELSEYFWAPLPLAVVFYLLSNQPRK